jgi:hypothetical protein
MSEGEQHYWVKVTLVYSRLISEYVSYEHYSVSIDRTFKPDCIHQHVN